MIGDSGVGKSCILLRFADDKFNDNFYTTIGVDFRFKSVEIDNKTVKYEIVSQNKFNKYFISGILQDKKDLKLLLQLIIEVLIVFLFVMMFLTGKVLIMFQIGWMK